MKLFKDVLVGENFVLDNGQQLIKVAPAVPASHNCLDYPFYQKRFSIADDTECLTVDELMEMSEPCDFVPADIIDPITEIHPTATEAQRQAAEAIASGFKNLFDKTDWASIAAEDARRKQEAIDRAEWVVETKISSGGRSVEVSAVIKGSHGHTSWGWHDGETKHIVLATTSTYAPAAPIARSIVDAAEDEARRICRAKNK